MAEQSAHKDEDGQVRRMYFTVVPGCRSRFQRRELEFAKLVGRNPGKPARDPARIALVFRTRVFPTVIGSPDLQDGVGNGLTVAIQDATSDRHDLRSGKLC